MREPGGLRRWSGRTGLASVPAGLVIAALLVVVCLVSMPRLADYVRHTNEADARRALVLLGPACFAAGDTAPADWTDVENWNRTLRHRLRDARALTDGESLLYHGYLFAVRPTSEGAQWLVAWPRDGGETGEGVYAWCPQRGALEASRGERVAWSDRAGAEGPLEPSGWTSLGVTP